MMQGKRSAETTAQAFAEAWIADWNRRDVDAVLSNFAEDVVFTSPVAQRIGFSSDGIVRGKTELRRYWTAALAQNPDLHFDLMRVFSGIDLLVIAYRNQQGSPRTEVLKFRNGLVVEGYGTVAA